MNYYRQCMLRKEHYVTGGSEVMHSWIPEQFAKVGNWVSIKNSKGEWEDGWKIERADTRLSEEQVLENSQDYKRTRKASDI